MALYFSQLSSLMSKLALNPEAAEFVPAQNLTENTWENSRPEDDTDDTVGCIVLDCFDRILLVKGGLPHFKISFPKGSRKIHETRLEGMLREVKEETGLDLSSFDIRHSPEPFVRGHYFYVKLKWSFESYNLKPAAEESGSVFWIYPEELVHIKNDKMNLDVVYFKDRMFANKGYNPLKNHEMHTKKMKQFL
jgi:8-oxo-dGTP pyrophosphatase MutT (NUDIX family)